MAALVPPTSPALVASGGAYHGMVLVQELVGPPSGVLAWDLRGDAGRLREV